MIIYHAANAQGIFAWKAHNLKLENVQVIAYGNPWGANPCPTRHPFGGSDCSNIKIYHSDNVSMDNVNVENGSRGISCVNCPDSSFKRIVAKNPRGPFPAGQAIQVNYSDNGIIEDFAAISDYDIAWLEDSISIYRSSNFTVKNGVIENNNAPQGVCLMFEGS